RPYARPRLVEHGRLPVLTTRVGSVDGDSGTTSDRALKDRFAPVDPAAVLAPGADGPGLRRRVRPRGRRPPHPRPRRRRGRAGGDPGAPAPARGPGRAPGRPRGRVRRPPRRAPGASIRRRPPPAGRPGDRHRHDRVAAPPALPEERPWSRSPLTRLRRTRRLARSRRPGGSRTPRRASPGTARSR